jgi:NAD(P)-dependent dehydrogenase (short-subunit alcohol dehydrogenase family)
MNGRRAIVTGAGGALGSAVASRLRADGGCVGATFRSDRGDLPADVPAVAADLADEDAVARAFAELAARLGGPAEILVHCAGAYAGAPLAQTSLQAWRRMLDANLTSAFLCVRAVLPAMCAAGWGRIVTVGSRAALRGDEEVAAYSASKGGLLRLTESAAAEGLSRGVTANCVLPGTIDTPDNRRAMPGADHRAWVPPAAIAEVCAFLCSDAAASVSGAALPVYGRS